MRDRNILDLILIAIFSSLPFAYSISGGHVCTRVENYTLTTRETYTEPVIVQTFTWCLQVPPRCPKTRMEQRQRFRIKTTIEQRTISECCDGYVLQELHRDTEMESKCIPFCKSCKNGICTEPNFCLCEPGYQGDDCAHECPTGSWGIRCMQRCDCTSKFSCDPVNGNCDCPAGWQGPRCKLPCPTGRWGFRCESKCNCAGKYVACDIETGNCLAPKNGETQAALERNWTRENLSRAVEISGPVHTASSDSFETRTTNFGTDTTVSDIYDDPWTQMDIENNDAKRFSRTTENMKHALLTVSDIPEESDPVKQVLSVSNIIESPITESSEELTPFEETISEKSLPLTPKLSEEFRYDDESEGLNSNAKIKLTPHRSYVKTIQKERDTQIPYDVTVLIIVGSVVSLCLITMAALMIFYLRCRVFDSIPVSIYSNGKNDKGQNREDTIKNLKITNTTLPPLPTFVNPVFAPNSETTLITFDAAELNKHYDNRTATISIRVSGNIRDLLESHYDRPPTAACRHTVDRNTEHVYDEIPLTAPLCVRKEA